jgi:hypothetical protein
MQAKGNMIWFEKEGSQTQRSMPMPQPEPVLVPVLVTAKALSDPKVQQIAGINTQRHTEVRRSRQDAQEP